MKKLLFFSFVILTVLLPRSGFARQGMPDADFEKEFIRLYVNFYSVNSDESFRLVDSLYQVAQTPRQKARALMLSSSLLGKEGRHIEAIEYAKMALEIATVRKNYTEQAFIYQNLVCLYADYGFFDKAGATLKLGLKKIGRAKDEPNYRLYKAGLIKAGGQLAMAKGDWKAAERDLQRALDIFKSRPKTSSAYAVTILRTYQLLGDVEVEQNRLDKALKTYRHGSRYGTRHSSSITLYEGRIYRGMANVFLKQKQLDSAKVYLDRSQRLADNKNLRNLKFKASVYHNLEIYYSRRKQEDSATYYRQLYTDLSIQEEVHNRQMVNGMMRFILEDAKRENEEARAFSKTSNGRMAAIGLVGLVVMGGGGLLYYRKRRAKQKDCDRLMMTMVEAEEYMGVLPIAEKENCHLSLEVVDALYKEIKKFEKDLRFLDPKMSFPMMVSTLNTNAKYLYCFLANEMNTEYSAYIHQKRIAYIVEKLETNLQWRNYKTTYLAEKAGYASYSTFYKQFKNIMESTPSAFVQDLEKASVGTTSG